MIDLALSEVEAMLLESLDRVFDQATSPGWTTTDDAVALDSALWRAMIEIVPIDPALLRPELGLSFGTLGLVAEVIGESLIGLPMLDHIVSARLLASVESPTPIDSAGPFALAVETDDQTDKTVSPFGAVAAGILTIGSNGVSIAAHHGARPAIANLGDLPVAVVGPGGEGLRLLPPGHDAATLALLERKALAASAIAGMARCGLDLAVAYATERVQFGAPIGSFQSIAHNLATVRVHVDSAQLLARKAAWLRDADPDGFERGARMAYAFASRACADAARFCIHVFGGYGVTRDYPVQAYFRTIKALTLAIGDRREDVTAIGRMVRTAAAPAGIPALDQMVA